MRVARLGVEGGNKGVGEVGLCRKIIIWAFSYEFKTKK
jgi:hypothetical protein